MANVRIGIDMAGPFTDLEAVRLDVLRGFVSAAGALEDYGVEPTSGAAAGTRVRPGAGSVDAAATVAAREQRRCERPPLRLIEHGPGFHQAVACSDLELTTVDPLLEPA